MKSIPGFRPPPYRALERRSVYLVSAVIIIATAVLAGWQWDILFLRRPIPGLAAMNPTTALAFLLTGLSFLALTRRRRSRYQRTLGLILAAAVALLGAGCLAGYEFPPLAGIDQWLFSTHLKSSDHRPHHMAINTALCFMLIGLSLLNISASGLRRRFSQDSQLIRRRIADAAALLTSTLALFCLLGYTYRVTDFQGWLIYFSMAVHTALCFLLLTTAILLATHKGIITTFTGSLTGSMVSRRLLPFAFLVPITLGWLRLWGHWKGFLTTELGVTLLVLSIIICFVFVIWYNARLLNNRDRLRQQVETALVAAESRWSSFVSSVKDLAILLVSPDGLILSWNEGAEKIKGYRSTEIVGQPISVFYTAEDNAAGEPRRNLQQAIANGSHHSQGWRIRKDGSRFWAEIVFTPIYDHHHELQGFAKITRDTTEQMLAQEKIAWLNTLLETQVKEKTAEISQSNADLRALASRLQDIREEERAAMAREIHDELGQQLTGLKMDLALITKRLSTADTEWLTSKTRETMTLLDTTIRTVRKIATELRPSILDDLGLVAAIDWQGQEFMKRSGINTSFHTDLPEIDLDPSTAIGLFRICQESLTNIGRHAGAKNVTIGLHAGPDGLILSVTDDGRGIDLQEQTNGKTLGLLGMKERALMMGGDLTINTSPGKGLTLSVHLPLHPIQKSLI